MRPPISSVAGVGVRAVKEYLVKCAACGAPVWARLVVRGVNKCDRTTECWRKRHRESQARYAEQVREVTP